jgi:ABC-type lipoprotein release transport system permease subunit
MVTGGDMEIEDSLIGISKNLIKGEMIGNDDYGVIIGSGLAAYLKISINDTLILYGSGYHGTTAANLYPIKGIVKFPLPQMNNSVVYLPITQAQQLFRAYDLYTSVSLSLNNIDDSKEFQDKFNSKFETPDLKAYHWRELNTILVQQIESDNFFGKIMIYIIYLLVGFGIFGTLLMMAMERRKENGVMNALGLKKSRLIVISFFETIWISLLGVVCGLLISSPLMAYFYLNPIEITGESAKMYEDMNIEPILEFSIKPGYLIDQALIVTVISLIMSIIPMYTIYKLNIPKSLKL